MAKRANGQLKRIHVDDGPMLSDIERAALRRLKSKQAIMPTPEEDAEITAGALRDPDNPPLAEGAMANFKPARRPRGRPIQEITKVSTTMRLDSDILDSFKATGSGWQTRINSALRVFLSANNLFVQRYHTIVTTMGTTNEYVVMAVDGDQAREKVVTFLKAEGHTKAARAKISTMVMDAASQVSAQIIY